MVSTVELFRRFFERVHGVEPFAWQRELAERVLDGRGWPDALDVPTGFGKTAAIDVAVFALARQADLPPAQRTAPTRTFVIVDRRLVVDQAYDRARRIADALVTSGDPVVSEVAERLRRIGGRPTPLEVVRMRGGITWASRWLPSPAQPAVIAGTVDQFGSRLLFRGYGVGERLRPIDAALCGHDALLLLDEAHLAPALVETTRAARKVEQEAERAILRERAPRPVLLSATLLPEHEGSTDVLRADPDAETSTTAQRRLRASRRVALYELDARPAERVERLAGVLARLAEAMLSADGEVVQRVAVVANTVATARAAFEQLRAALGGDADVELLIGRCRGFEREQLGLVSRIQQLFGASESRPTLARPAVVVATQTIEVGADLDVDALVTEAAPLDALLQRLGRLNRLGLRERADAACVYVPSVHSADDPVYGDAIARTWQWLCGRVGHPPLTLGGGKTAAPELAPTLDLGLAATRDLVGPADIEVCASPRPDVPVLLRPHVDAWTRTSPTPEPDQPVAPFLHGLDRGSPEVFVCWRAPLPTLDAWRAELEALPVRDEERVELPLWTARNFLQGLGTGPLADVEALGEPSAEDGAAAPGVGRVRGVAPPIVQRVDGTVVTLTSPAALRPGDTIILDPESGGHDAWGWTGSNTGPTTDVADLVQRRSPAIRVRPALLAWATGVAPGAFAQALATDDAAPGDVAQSLLAEAAAAARSREDGSPLLARWAEHAERMRQDLLDGRARAIRVGSGRTAADLGILVVARRAAVADQESDEGEATTSIALAPVPLADHCAAVAARARDFGERIGLPPDLSRAVELAGLVHDTGKADMRFQVMLHRGDPDRFEASGVTLAKSGMPPGDRAAFRRARERAGLPAGWRHEAASLAIAERVLAALEEEVDRELIAHLVAAHHGRARPLFPPVETADSVALTPPDSLLRAGGITAAVGDRVPVDHLDWAGPSRLAKLSRRYGPWGLALLETIVRLADMAISEEEA